jgi:hypothetical protein
MGSIYPFNLNMTQSNLGGPCGPRGSRARIVGITGFSRCEWLSDFGTLSYGVLP